MKIYLLIIKDRHSDTTVIPYYKSDKAIEKARELAKEYCQHKEDYKEEDIDGWLFYARYSCEGDHVIVTEAEMVD